MKREPQKHDATSRVPREARRTSVGRNPGSAARGVSGEEQTHQTTEPEAAKEGGLCPSVSGHKGGKTKGKDSHPGARGRGQSPCRHEWSASEAGALIPSKKKKKYL